MITLFDMDVKAFESFLNLSRNVWQKIADRLKKNDLCLYLEIKKKKLW